MNSSIKSSLFLTALSIAAISACTSNSPNHEEHLQELEQRKVVSLTSEQVEASGPYLTFNQAKNPVLCWTESVNEQEGYVLKYAVFNPATEAFEEPVSVLPSIGTRAHPESMNKVAFKADGTIIALFAVKHPSETNPFAGSIYYTLSTDSGESWSDAAYLHSDTLPYYGRGYFDMATLPDGEVGAVWLDGRFADADTGSALFFAKTIKGKGFGIDQQIGESTCECCRTDIHISENGKIHVAYRDITFPLNLVGKQLRDMSYSSSDDFGKTFSRAKKLSVDNWAIEGCPHTGPSLATNEQGLHALWFTEGGGSGVYYTHSSNYGDSFSPRELISKDARYPQLIALPGSALAMLWTEPEGAPEKLHAGTTNTHQHGGNHSSPAANHSKIMLQWRVANKIKETLQVSDRSTGHATNPVAIPIQKNKVLVAWTQMGKHNSGSGVKYTIVELDQVQVKEGL